MALAFACLAVLLLAAGRAAAVGLLHDEEARLDGFDARGSVAVGDARRAAAAALEARVTWNRFGTPHTLSPTDGWLARGLSRDPVAAAREFLAANAALYRHSPAEIGTLELVNDVRLSGSSDAHVVLLGQDFGRLPLAGGGLVAVGVIDGRVAYASSALGADRGLAGEVRIDPRDAWLKAAASVGERVAADDLAAAGRASGFDTFAVEKLNAQQQVRLAALPMPGGPARRVYEANVVDNGADPSAYTVYLDAETGEALRRVDRLDNAANEPRWKYFTNIPPLDGSDTDRRKVGCFPVTPTAPLGAGCEIDERTTPAAGPAPWDVLGGAGSPTFTTNGNNADSALSALSPFTPGPDRLVRPSSPTRDYIASWTDAWRNVKCNPSVFTGGIVPASGPDTFGGTNANDVNAAVISLFANHNRMHDWSYNLGFTEATYNLQVNNFGRGGAQGDPELGDAQGGALAGGSPTYTGRDNANQITPQDGIAPITNMYLWQPIGAAFYPPCVDGDFDMSVIGHEYTHAISNRMVGGPDNGLTSTQDGQARALGESFSDFTAVEYLQEYGYAPADDENPFAVGPYVTGSKQKGIRNYAMNASPLNYSNVQGYDGSGNASPHDDGEIWSAANFDIRQALIEKYGAGTPALQHDCADGLVPVGQCPGNRRWMQLVFDSYLLMPPDGEVSMLEARDALLAADQMRFGGANQAELWTAFARRGFGEHASSTNPADVGFAGDSDDPDPIPSFESPLRTDESTLTFRPTAPDAGESEVEAELFVGDYEARVTPVADTDRLSPLGNQVKLLPGTYSFVVRADGYGMHKFTLAIAASSQLDLNVTLPPNTASAARGAVASGDGVNKPLLIDDTEETNWATINRSPDVAGAQVTVALAGGAQLVERVHVSALLRGANPENEDPGSQNRFTALRQFEIQTCTASTANDQCRAGGAFTSIYTSPPDAFPGEVPRPLAPDMNLRTFDVPDTTATHVRLVVITNQCLDHPVFSDNTLDNDPTSNSSCEVGNPLIPRADRTVRAAELQVFSAPAVVTTTTTGGSDPGPDPGPGPGPGPGPYAPGECTNRVLGKAGDDRLRGTAGSDEVRGRAGRDRISGRGGDDCIFPGRGQDRVKAGGGEDRVYARRGARDRVDCGRGKDTVFAGRGDRVRRCEKVRRKRS